MPIFSTFQPVILTLLPGKGLFRGVTMAGCMLRSINQVLLFYVSRRSMCET
jgi:hypothetical protein